MPWLIAVLIVLALIGLTWLFVINAQMLKRDVSQRRDAFRARLESDANAIVDELLKANDADGVPPGPRVA
jgi:hypothetical protein